MASRHVFRRLALGMAFAVACLGISKFEFAGSVRAAETVNVSMFTWPGYAWLFVAKEKNLAPDLDINIQIIEDPLQSYSMVASGQLDATMSTAEYGPIAAEQGLPFKTVAFSNFSCGADRIILRPEITEAAQLKGQKVAVLEGGLSQIFMGLWLERNGVAYNEVQFVNLIMDDAASALIGGDVKAGEFWEPHGSQVLNNLKGSHVAASTNEPFFKKTAMISDAIYFSDKLIKTRRDVALKLLKAFYDGQAYWQAHPEEGNQIIAKALKFKIEDVAAILGPKAEYCIGGGYFAPFITDARVCGVAPGDPGHSMPNGAIAGAFSLINEWWLKLGTMKKTVPVESGVDCSLLGDLVKAGYKGAEPPADSFK